MGITLERLIKVLLLYPERLIGMVRELGVQGFKSKFSISDQHDTHQGVFMLHCCIACIFFDK